MRKLQDTRIQENVEIKKFNIIKIINLIFVLLIKLIVAFLKIISSFFSNLIMFIRLYLSNIKIPMKNLTNLFINIDATTFKIINFA